MFLGNRTASCAKISREMQVSIAPKLEDSKKNARYLYSVRSTSRKASLQHFPEFAPSRGNVTANVHDVFT